MTIKSIKVYFRRPAYELKLLENKYRRLGEVVLHGVYMETILNICEMDKIMLGKKLIKNEFFLLIL